MADPRRPGSKNIQRLTKSFSRGKKILLIVYHAHLKAGPPDYGVAYFFFSITHYDVDGV